MEEELKACPCCGCAGEESKGNSFLYLFKHKKDCILGRIITVDVRSMDAKSWNTRAEPKQEEYKEYDFYKQFYDENRVRMLQYDSLRKNFKKMVRDILGSDYYNMGMDVYVCDEICCEDITSKVKSFWKTLWQEAINKITKRGAPE